MNNTGFSAIIGAVLCATCITGGQAGASPAPVTPSSTAITLTMNASYPQDSNPADNYPVGLYPVLQITGKTAPYRLVKHKAVGQSTMAWNGPGEYTYGEIDFNFTGFTDIVAGTSAGVNTAKASVGNTSIVILQEPGNPALLTVNLAGDTITASATGPVTARKYAESGTTTGITLSGALISTPVSVPAGKLAPNTVLFSSSTMQIIANATSKTTAGLEVVGLEIIMAGQDLNGTSMTGTIKFLDAQAQ
jgi:hypothetical protein